MDHKEFSEICAGLANTADAIRQSIEFLAPGEECSKPNDDTFSILENVCHLRDIEEHGYTTRISRILNENCPYLPNIDGKRLAIERDYQRRNLEEELDYFSASRQKSLSYLHGISLADLEKTGDLQDVGTVTLGRLLANMIEHDKEHLQFIKDLQQH